jgi:CelD/BcsL family acetyltransferase involved in cellulose biosynthesis
MGSTELNQSWDLSRSAEALGHSSTAGEIIVPQTNRSVGAPRAIYLRSLEELRAAASSWDDLWLRGEATLPTLRAELLARWIEHFAPRARFHAVVIEQGGRWAAALPLVQRTIGRLIRAGALPCNEWSSSGDLLLDSSAAETDQTLELLIAALAECNWPLLWLEEAMLQSPRWQAFAQVLAKRDLRFVIRPRWQVGLIRIQGDWQTCQAGWSRKHRQNMARLARQLARQGEVGLTLHSRFAPGEAAVLLQRAWQIENLGWKGRVGSSVMSVPGMRDFFLRQAEQLAAWGQLELVFLHCGRRPIAFCYGQNAKGVFHSAKIGYDPEFSPFSPGQLLRYFLLEQFYAEPGRKAVDFLGPMTESHARWRPETYTVSRLGAALHPLGGAALWAYEHLRRIKRRRRD